MLPPQRPPYAARDTVSLMLRRRHDDAADAAIFSYADGIAMHFARDDSARAPVADATLLLMLCLLILR